MPITDSRNRYGTLTLDGDAFAVQATSVKLTPSVDEEGDAVETLSGATIDPDEVTTWVLEIVGIQDFELQNGFVDFCFNYSGLVVPFEWKPSDSATAPTYTGTCKVRAIEIGGEVKSRLSSTATFPVVTGPDREYPTP
ncbi:hypothetical protein GCM10027425_09250 [Alteromonas gracilis]